MFKSFILTFYYWFNLVILKIVLSPSNTTLKLTTFGNAGAAWKVPLSLLKSNSICYCAGVGEDISFEKELFRTKQPHIFLFDPTPRAINFVKTIHLPKKIKFIPWGLWSKNSRQKFFSPSSESFVSHSIVNLHHTTKYFKADCKSLTWIMKKLEHTQLDLLKIDIEGAEYVVLHQLLKSSSRPKILAVEFDQPTPVLKTFRMIRQLITSGYQLIDHTNWNFIFVYRN